MQHRIKTVFMLAIGAACLGNAVQAQNLLNNSSFENTSAAPTWSGPDGGVGSYFTNSFTLTGWTASGVSLHSWHSGLTSHAADGEKAVDLNGDSPGSITQSLTLTAGNRYRLSWKDSRHYMMSGTTAATYTVTVNGATSTQSVTPGVVVGGTPNWESKSLEFVATNASTSLVFTGQTPTGGLGPFIDAVELRDITPNVILFCSPGALTDSPSQVASCWIAIANEAPAGGLSVPVTQPTAMNPRFTFNCPGPLTIAAGETTSTEPCTVTATPNTPPGDGSVNAMVQVEPGAGYTVGNNVYVLITDDDKVTAVPSLSAWGLMLLSAALAVLGLRRRAR